MSQVYIVKEAPHLELAPLEGQQPQNVTHCIPMSSSNISITYTMITTIETQTLMIGVTKSNSLDEVLQSDLHCLRKSLSNNS